MDTKSQMIIDAYMSGLLRVDTFNTIKEGGFDKFFNDFELETDDEISDFIDYLADEAELSICTHCGCFTVDANNLGLCEDCEKL